MGCARCPKCFCTTGRTPTLESALKSRFRRNSVSESVILIWTGEHFSHDDVTMP